MTEPMNPSVFDLRAPTMQNGMLTVPSLAEGNQLGLFVIWVLCSQSLVE